MIRDVTTAQTETTLRRVISEGENYGRSQSGQGRKVLVEFVSANPNSPITVGSARAGVIGDVLANVLEAVGCQVYREYYVNDVVNIRQMENLGRSLEARYLQALGQDVEFPEDGYKAEFVTQIAKQVVSKSGDKYLSLSKADRVLKLTEIAEREMLTQQKSDLKAFGVSFDNWYSESALYESGKVQAAIDRMRQNGYAYESGGAIWLKSTAFGDDKDRALLRRNEQLTYIAGDAAYHADKFDRGYDHLINVWGPQHTGYIARTKAAVSAMGYDPERLDIIIYQTVRLFSDGELVMMSKRAGELISLGELLEEAGSDAARFFLALQPANAFVDFDLEAAKEQSADNPLYRVQSAHALACKELEGCGPMDVASLDLSLLDDELEMGLVQKLADYPEEVEAAASAREPYRIARYVHELAEAFHEFSSKRSGEQQVAGDTRLALVQAARITMRCALGLLGVSAQERIQ